MTVPSQLLFPFDHDAGHSRDDLLVSAANAEAVALLDRWPDWPSQLVVLAGPPGAGKSHVGAIWADAAGAFMSPPDGLASVAAIPEHAAAVLIDGIEPGRFDETALFHLLNEARHRGMAVLITSRLFPSAWGVDLADLASRLRAATVVEIGEPDDALLAGIIAKLFADRQVAVEHHVVQYIVARIERSLATAISVVARLDELALAEKSRITRALAARVIGEAERGQGSFGF